MAIFIQTFRTSLVDGVATADSELVTMALYGVSEPFDMNDGAAIRIIDENGNGLIDKLEFRDASEHQGVGLNAGSDVLLFDGTPPLNDWTGTLYGPSAVAEGADVTSYLSELDKNFPGINPENLEDVDDGAAPDGNPIGPDPVCFTHGTMIMTPAGERPIEDLRPGDLVTTVDHGPQPLRWIRSRRTRAATLRTRPWLRPVQIDAGALAPGVPHSDMRLSPQHRVMLCSAVVQRMYPEDKGVLVPAKKLAGFPGISFPARARAGLSPVQAARQQPAEDVWYVHMLFDRHEVVIANGAPVETLLTGPVALQSMGPEARREIEDLFLVPPGPSHQMAPARPIPFGRRLKRLLDRHAENGRPFCEGFSLQEATRAEDIPAPRRHRA